MNEKKRINIYIPEELHKEVKDYLVDATEFKTISHMITKLLERYLDGKEIVEQSKIDKIEKDLKITFTDRKGPALRTVKG